MKLKLYKVADRIFNLWFVQSNGWWWHNVIKPMMWNDWEVDE